MKNASVPARDRISSAFIKLLHKKPFLAIVGMRFPVVKDDSMPTMYVDGKVIGYNEQFVMSLTPDELQGVVAHEILHLAFMHLYRRGGRNPMLWNYATDLVVNWILEEEGFVLPKGALYSKEFENMVAEEVYDILEKRAQKIRSQLGMSGGAGNAQEQGAGNKNQGAGSQGNQGGSDGQGSQDSQGSGDGMDPFEKALIEDLFRNGAQGTKMVGSHAPWERAAQDPAKDTARRKLEQTLREAQMIVQQKSQGTGAGLIDRLVNEFLNPKIHWSRYVRRYIQPREEEHCFTSPNPYYSYRGDIAPILNDIPLPGETKRGGKLEGVVFVLDTSGSISDKEAAQYIAEMQGLMREFPDTYAMYMSCDWECTEPVDLQTVDGSTIDIKSIRLKGGGGTSFKPPFEFFERPENRRKYDVKLLIYFTDGYGEFPTKKPPYPVIFCVSTERIKDVPQWAVAVQL